VHKTTVRGAGKAPSVNLKRGFVRTIQNRAHPDPPRFSSVVAVRRPWNLKRHLVCEIYRAITIDLRLHHQTDRLPRLAA